ncbi:ATP-binding protein [Undibacterium sp. SXout20W]|uniref:ATP-binding protein n=1 Tax=Undibacterium sp. SXout20W TaxID=3413051 RepID=UPI003BF2DB83
MDQDHLQTHRTYIHSEADVHCAVMQVYAMLVSIHAVPTLATEVATVASELAMNIVKYAGCDGTIVVSMQKHGRRFIDIVAEDRGHGIANIEQAMVDHFSTKGTLGLGLPGVKRMVDEFEITSELGNGTRVSVKKWLDPEHNKIDFGGRSVTPAPVAPSPLAKSEPSQQRATATKAHLDGIDYAMVSRPCFGEVVSGDGTICHRLPNGILIGIIDILGHGQEAHELARFSEKWFEQHRSSDVAGVMQALHLALKGSRGSALTLAYVSQHQITVAGVGNTILYCVGEQVTSFVAQPGIVGSNFPRLRPVTASIHPGNMLILTTDGISEHIDSSQLISRSRLTTRQLVNGLLNDYGKMYDDATCMAMRYQV